MIRIRKASLSLTRIQPLLFDRFRLAGGARAVLGGAGPFRAAARPPCSTCWPGLLFPIRGQIRVDGQPLARPRPQTGLILQDYGLLPWNTVLENVRLGLRIRQFYGPDGKHAQRVPAGRPRKCRGAIARNWLDRSGLVWAGEAVPRAAFRRPAPAGGHCPHAGRSQPDLLLMDEPFSSLDAPTRQGLRDLTLALWREQRFTFVVVTHAIEEAAHLGQKILVLGQPPHTRGRGDRQPVLWPARHWPKAPTTAR